MRIPCPSLAGTVLLLACIGVGLLAFDWHRRLRPAYCLEQGLAAAREGHVERAEQFAHRLEEAGETDHARLVRSEAWFRQGRFEQALVALNHIRQPGDLRLEARHLSGCCLLALGERREAERLFRSVADEQPTHADSRRYLAAIYWDQGNLAQAAERLHEVTALDPTDARANRLLGLIYKDLGKAAEAIDSYREALRLITPGDPEAPKVRLELAECLVTLTRGIDALEVLEGLDSPSAEALRAEALLQAGRAEDAERTLDDALQRKANDGALRRLRAERCLAHDQAVEALRFLEPVVAADPNDHRARYQLALAYGRLGRKSDARNQQRLADLTRTRLDQLTELNRLAMQDPWNADVRRHLAEVCEQLGRADWAAMWRRAADACSPTAKRSPDG